MAKVYFVLFLSFGFSPALFAAAPDVCNIAGVEKALQEVLDGDATAVPASSALDNGVPAETAATIRAEVNAKVDSMFSEKKLAEMYGDSYVPPRPAPGALPSLKYGVWEENFTDAQREAFLKRANFYKEKERERQTKAALNTAAAEYAKKMPPAAPAAPQVTAAPPPPATQAPATTAPRVPAASDFNEIAAHTAANQELKKYSPTSRFNYNTGPNGRIIEAPLESRQALAPRATREFQRPANPDKVTDQDFIIDSTRKRIPDIEDFLQRLEHDQPILRDVVARNSPKNLQAGAKLQLQEIKKDLEYMEKIVTPLANGESIFGNRRLFPNRGEGADLSKSEIEARAQKWLKQIRKMLADLSDQ